MTTSVKTSWPWIVGLITIAAIFNPVGFAVIEAVMSGEQLARTIGQFMFLAALGILAVLALIEFGIRKYLITRQRRKALRT